jgi:hypothetical protein
MSATPKNRWAPSGSLLAVLALAVYYLLVFQPLAGRVRQADKALISDWDRFVASNRTSLACAGLALDGYTNRLQQLRLAATNLTAVGRLVSRRVDLPAGIRGVMSGPFSLIDLQNERQRQTEELTQLARERGVKLEPGASNGLAVDAGYSVDMENPAMLWARLHFTSQLVRTALESKIGGLTALNQLPDTPYRAALDGSVFLVEAPMRLELYGATEAVNRFLASLPLPATAMTSVGLPATLTNKPVLFINQLLVRKSAPDHPGDVSVEVNVSGFVPVPEAGTGAPGAGGEGR